MKAKQLVNEITLLLDKNWIYSQKEESGFDKDKRVDSVRLKLVDNKVIIEL